MKKLWSAIAADDESADNRRPFAPGSLDALDSVVRRCMFRLIDYREAMDAWQNHRTTAERSGNETAANSLQLARECDEARAALFLAMDEANTEAGR